MGKVLSYIAQTEQEACVALLVAIAYSDKPTYSHNELYRISQLRFRSAIMPIPHDERIFTTVQALHGVFGSKALVDGSVDRVNSSDRHTVFTYCCEVAYADVLLSKLKQEILFYIGKALEITPEFFKVCITYQRSHSAKDDPYVGKRGVLHR